MAKSSAAKKKTPAKKASQRPARSAKSSAGPSHSIEKIRTLFRDASKTRLENLSGFTGVKIHPVTREDVLTDKHFCMSINLECKIFNAFFACYFTIPRAKILVEKSLQMSLEEIKDRLAHDFVKEFCNLTMGAVKEIIIKAVGESVFGITVQVPQAQMVQKGAQILAMFAGNMCDSWKLEYAPDQMVIATLKITVNDPNQMDNLTITGTELLAIEQTDGGQVEFL